MVVFAKTSATKYFHLQLSIYSILDIWQGSEYASESGLVYKFSHGKKLTL